MDADRGGSASSFMPTGGGQIFPAWMDADRGEKIFLSQKTYIFQCFQRSQKKIFDKNSGKIRRKRSENGRNPLFFNASIKFIGGVDKRFYPVLIFNHADGVKPRNKTTETKGERNNE